MSPRRLPRGAGGVNVEPCGAARSTGNVTGAVRDAQLLEAAWLRAGVANNNPPNSSAAMPMASSAFAIMGNVST